MAREGTPRVRNLKHRALARVKHQPVLSAFITERNTTLTQYADEDAVWARLKSVPAVVLAAEINIP